MVVCCGVALSGVKWLPQTEAIQAASAPAAHTTLRVGMWTLWRDRDVVLQPAGPAREARLRTCAGCASAPLAQPATVHAEGDNVTLRYEGKTLHFDGIWLSGTVALSAHHETVTLHNPVVITARADVLVIAVTLPVEDYVERVVASESGSADSPESLKALAVVVRTFALHEAHGHAEYDLCDSTHCQLLHWSGNHDRQPAAHAAALATSDETLWFHGQRALGYFHKDCGGRTASPDEVWPHAKRVSYLPSQTDRYCTANGGREWSAEITRADLTTALAAHGLMRAGWQSLSVARRGESGRAVMLRLDTNEIPAEEFQLAAGETLGWSRIPSTWFEVSRQGDRFQFHGRGWGHGVGLCQTGAAVMAEQGRTSSEILTQYFPGTEAADETAGRVWQSFKGSGFVLESLDAADGSYLSEIARARAEASERSGLSASHPFTVRAFDTTSAFREATLAPGWVAAFTERDWIAAQPLRTLAARHLLNDTMRHEFLHGWVEQQAGPGAPLWLREGLVEVWSEVGGEPHSLSVLKSPPALKVDEVDAALAHAATETESEIAHRAAGWYAAQLLARYGRAPVLNWLRSGVPASAIAAIGQR